MNEVPGSSLKLTLKGLGWRTGAAADKASCLKTVAEFMPKHVRDHIQESTTSAVYVASQSCDLLHDCIEVEPFAELITADLGATRQDGRAFLKSYRHLQLRHQTIGIVEFSAHRRFTIPRDSLTQIARAETNDLSWSEGLRLCSWIGQRYGRLPLPDELVKRLPLYQSPVEAHFKRISGAATEVRIHVTPDDRDLEKDEKYLVQFYCLMPPGNQPESVSRAQDGLNKWANNLSGVDLRIHYIPTDSFSYASFMKTRRLDLDRFTFGVFDGPRGALPAPDSA